MRINKPSRTALITETLIKAGKPLTLQNLNRLLKIPIPKLRSSLTNYRSAVVRIGDSLYDLRTRAYQGKQLRIRPSAEDLKTGKLSLDEEAYLYFDGLSFKFNVSLIAVQTGQKLLTLKIHRKRQERFRHKLFSLKPWYKQVNFSFGDDIIFTCQNIEKHEFSMARMPYQERDNLAIKVANKMLADAAYSALNYEISRSAGDMFIVRNYSFLIKPSTPPDSMNEVLAGDPRFVNNYSNRLVSWTGYLIGQSDPIHGQRKYYYFHHSGAYVPVPIITDDEFGERFGVCSVCDGRMIWESWCGWRHCYSDAEWVNTKLPGSFRAFVPTHETVLAFRETLKKLPPCPGLPKQSTFTSD